MTTEPVLPNTDVKLEPATLAVRLAAAGATAEQPVLTIAPPAVTHSGLGDGASPDMAILPTTIVPGLSRH